MSRAIRIYGVDFSGARDPSRGLYVASGTLDVEAGAFELERCEPCDDRLDVFAKLLQSPPDALWAIDAPFAPASPAYERMGFTEWEEWLDLAAGSSRSSFLAALEEAFPAYESPCAAYSWACRRTDVAAGAASPFKAVNPNLRAMSYAAWKLLSYARAAGCAVYPFDGAAGARIAGSAPALFEVYPSHTARLLRGSRSLDLERIAEPLRTAAGWVDARIAAGAAAPSRQDAADACVACMTLAAACSAERETLRANARPSFANSDEWNVRLREGLIVRLSSA
ncbi:hypothetical protein [Paenibacillus sp.]|uniref:hypothetical protein n=1 Tax=Paenibacillus sp. TaxID=58172 RepID=UPI002D495DD0|nr:hypothetical protein [Paenibacillus sp.]HZG88558.1 hypothetical protein [Paenibacillus sp.]